MAYANPSAACLYLAGCFVRSMGHSLTGHLLLSALYVAITLVGLLFSAHKLYPVRVRLVNDVSETIEWVTVAYVPIVRKLQEPGADERARIRRCGILQRVIYAAFTHVIGRSHIGFRVKVNGQKALAFPRVLLYLCDQPEERAVLGLKGGQCPYPCTSCMAKIEIVGAPQAVNAADGNVINTVTNQVESYAHMRHQRQRQRRVALSALDSTSGGVPGLAGMAGLGTAPLLLYRMIGFDVLHVCCSWTISTSFCIEATARAPLALLHRLLNASAAPLRLACLFSPCFCCRSWTLGSLACWCTASCVCSPTFAGGRSLRRVRAQPHVELPLKDCCAYIGGAKHAGRRLGTLTTLCCTAVEPHASYCIAINRAREHPLEFVLTCLCTSPTLLSLVLSAPPFFLGFAVQVHRQS